MCSGPSRKISMLHGTISIRHKGLAIPISVWSRIQVTKPLPPAGRLQSLGEEIANSLSSGIGLMAVIAGIPLLVGSAIQRRNEFSLAGAIVFAADSALR
jgi:predicted membrane channel-forming protein YqfA (hemolysin III family)